MAERALPMLDLSGSSSQVANNWRKWKQPFEYYFTTSQLLHYAGMEVQDIFRSGGTTSEAQGGCIRCKHSQTKGG